MRSFTPRLACSRATCALTRSRYCRSPGEFAARSCVGVALAEQLLEHRAQPLLRQRLCRRPPRQPCAGHRRRQLQRRDPRVPGRCAAPRTGAALTPTGPPDAEVPGAHAELGPRHLGVAVGSGSLAGLVGRSRTDGQVLASGSGGLKIGDTSVGGAGLPGRARSGLIAPCGKPMKATASASRRRPSTRPRGGTRCRSSRRQWQRDRAPTP